MLQTEYNHLVLLQRPEELEEDLQVRADHVLRLLVRDRAEDPTVRLAQRLEEYIRKLDQAEARDFRAGVLVFHKEVLIVLLALTSAAVPERQGEQLDECVE